MEWPPKSTIDSLLQMRRVSISLHCDLRDSCGDIAEVLLGQFDVRCAQILLKPMQLRCSGNRNNPRFLSKQPSNRDLRRCSLLLPRNVAKHIHKGLVRFPVLLIETWNDVAKIGAIELRFLVNCAREETLPQRTKWHEADAEFIESRQNLALHLSPPERIFALHGGDWLNGVRTTDRLNTGLGKTEVLYFALPDQVLYSTGNVFDGHVRIDAVLVKKIDDIGPESFQGCIGNFSDALRTAIQALVRISILEAELGRDYNLLTKRLNGLAHQFLIRKWAVCLSRIKNVTP